MSLSFRVLLAVVLTWCPSFLGISSLAHILQLHSLPTILLVHFWSGLLMMMMLRAAQSQPSLLTPPRWHLGVWMQTHKYSKYAAVTQRRRRRKGTLETQELCEVWFFLVPPSVAVCAAALSWAGWVLQTTREMLGQADRLIGQAWPQLRSLSSMGQPCLFPLN